MRAAAAPAITIDPAITCKNEVRDVIVSHSKVQVIELLKNLGHACSPVEDRMSKKDLADKAIQIAEAFATRGGLH